MSKFRPTEIKVLDNAFEFMNGPGYVLNFSDRTFALYFDQEFGINIDDARYASGGTSKGKRLKTLLTKEDGRVAARVLRSLWEYRAGILNKEEDNENPDLPEQYFKIVNRLERDSTIASTDAIERFTLNETLDELIAAIQRDINSNKPQAALDRLHTYCMKKFAHLLKVRNSSCSKEDPLHSRVGRYVNFLKIEGKAEAISLLIMKSSISVFEEFNNIRNTKTFAHDNEIIGLHEARFIFDSISNILRFMRSLESNRFEDN